MKKQGLLSRLLLPTIIVLLLLPPLSCLVFSHAARQYAYVEAAKDLENLQQHILPLMKSSFDTHDISAEPVRTFLSQVGPLVRRMGGDAQLMILGGKLQVIYPHEEQEKEAITPLAEEFIQYIQTVGLPTPGKAVALQSATGESYLVNIYEIPTKSVQLQYLITYCSTSQISSWVRSASILVLLISSIFVLLIIAVLWMTARSITQPLYRLCQGAKQIGNGQFAEIQPSFSLKELEELRLAMNGMSAQLMRSEQIQQDFFQNVSHELRNPLMSISGYAQGIEQGIFHSPQEAAHIIIEESTRLKDLVNSLLTLSRLESDGQKSILIPPQIADSIENCLERLNGLAVQENISLVLQPFDRTITAYGEEELLSKVLDNLLTNAIRYAKMAVIISVSATGSHVFISVSDDGDGIAERDLPHLFERCYKGKDGNFGIGLAIVRSAAQKMNGELLASNLKNSGAIFTLSLKKANDHSDVNHVFSNNEQEIKYV